MKSILVVAAEMRLATARRASERADSIERDAWDAWLDAVATDTHVTAAHAEMMRTRCVAARASAITDMRWDEWYRAMMRDTNFTGSYRRG